MTKTVSQTTACMMGLLVAIGLIGGSANGVGGTAEARVQMDITAAEARAIAKEAYIYGSPMVDGYRIQYAYFVDTKNPEYKAPWNQIRNIGRSQTGRLR